MSDPARARLRGAIRTLPLLAALAGASPALAADLTVWPGQDIQSALDTVGDMGGGRVVLLEGTHRLRDSIELRSGVDLTGQAGVSPARIVIKPHPDVEPFNEPLVMQPSGGVLRGVRLAGFKVRCDIPAERQDQAPSIADLPLDAPSHADLEGEQIGIALRGVPATWVHGVSDVEIVDVEVRNCARGILVDGAWGVELEGVKLHRNGLVRGRFHNLEIVRSANVRVHHSSVYQAATGDGIHVRDASGVAVERNQVASNARHGITLGRSGATAPVSEFRLARNEVKRNAGAGLRLRNVLSGVVAATNAWANGVNYDVEVIPGVRFHENTGGCIELPMNLGQYCDAGL